jgi:hypothetical protein
VTLWVDNVVCGRGCLETIRLLSLMPVSHGPAKTRTLVWNAAAAAAAAAAANVNAS